MPVADRLLTTNEAIAYLKVGRNTFYRWRRAGLIMPANQNDALERQVEPRFAVTDLDAFVESKRTQRTAQRAG